MNPPDTDDALTPRAERRLRDALETGASAATPRPDWDDVVARAGRRRGVPAVRGTHLLAAAAMLVALAMVGGLLAVLDGGDDGRVITEPGPGPVAGEPGTGPDEDGVPDAGRGSGRVVDPLTVPDGGPLGDTEMVAIVARDGQETTLQDLVVLDGRTGDVVRTLESGVPGHEGGIYNLTLSPDRRTALYAEATSACEGVVRAVAVDGSGPPVTLLAGNGASLSPDRSRLALDPRSSCTPPNQLELVPVAGGTTTIFGEDGTAVDGMAPVDGSDATVLVSTAFVDDTTVAYVSSPLSSTGIDRPGLWLLDLDAGRDRPIAVPDGVPGDRIAWVGARSDGVLDIVVCCDDADRTTLVVLDGADAVTAATTDGEVRHGSTHRELGTVVLTGAGELVVNGEVLRRDVDDLAVGGRLDEGPGPGGDELSAEDVDVALAVVQDFLEAYPTGDVDAAAAMWTGYPVVDDDPDAKAAELRRRRDTSDWYELDGEAYATELVVVPAWSFTQADAVVTTLVTRDGDPPQARAFLVALDGPDRGRIVRLPDPDRAATVAPEGGSTLAPGDVLEVDGIPTEGGARAFFGDVEADVAVDHERLVTSITVPDGVRGLVAVTLTAATPEQPAVMAWPFVVEG